MVQLEKLKTKLHNTVGTVDLEDKCLEEYKAELDFLMQEKMAHVEELRLINADINLVSIRKPCEIYCCTLLHHTNHLCLLSMLV
jgi:16S rRNA G527 N7-methylase RsmG